MISIYNSVESPIKDIEILGNTVDGVSVGILQDDGQYKITLFTNNGLDNMSPDYREDKEELLLPCQLEKIGDSTDRLYYDKEEKAWCIYKVGQSKIVLPITFTISLNSFYGTTNLYMVSGEVEGTIKAKVSKSLGASVSSLNDKADVLIDKIDAMLGGKVDLDGYATIEYVDVKDGEIKGVLDNMFEEYTEEQISVDFPNASTISIVDNDDLFTSTTIEGALRELANNSGSGNAEGIKFDNSSNEMTSVNVQDAIEENKTSILNIENELSKTENTSYTTENGIKEFECKDGYVDNVVIEGQTKILNAENQECEAGVEGAKLVSVGQGDKIEVLTYDNVIINLFNGGLQRGYFSSDDGSFVSQQPGNAVGYCNSTPIDISSKKSLHLNLLDNRVYSLSESFNVFYYDSSFSFICSEKISYNKKLNIPNNAKFLNFKFNASAGGSSDYTDLNIALTESPIKQDKKQILTTLRSLPNGVKDTIEKRGNKYVKVQRCGEITLNGNENWVISQTNTNCIKFDIQSYTSIKLAPNGLCDKFNWENGALVSDYEFIGGHGSSRMIRCSILKSKLSTQDLAGFKTWLASNPVTVVYELATPVIEELPNFNPQTFSDKTTLLLNSGVVQAECDFEVTNSLGSELEVLKNKVSDGDNYKNMSVICNNGYFDTEYKNNQNIINIHNITPYNSGDLIINTSGWYTIAEFKFTEPAQSDASYGVSFILNLNRAYNNINNESYTFLINGAYGKYSILQLNSVTNNHLYKKIRIVSRTPNNTLKVELYTEVSQSNQCSVSVVAPLIYTCIGFECNIHPSDGLGNVVKESDITLNGRLQSLSLLEQQVSELEIQAMERGI